MLNQCPECLVFFYRETCASCGKKFTACGCEDLYCPTCAEGYDSLEAIEAGEFDYTQDGDGDGIVPLW